MSDIQAPAGKRQGDLPGIDCVVIGVNCSATLKRCLESIRACDYPQDLLEIFYVDGGSSDDSTEIARSIDGVRVIQLNSPYPSPGRGRNGGWKAGKARFVQFLDSDTIMAPDWLRRGIDAFQADVAAVFGNRNEIHPDRSIYNWIGELEWNGKPGYVESFGGDVLVRRQVLEKTGGYDDNLVSGEDPEFSRRICISGWKILHIDCDMTRHDLAMVSIGQYVKRAYRSGYGFAAVIDKFSGTGSTFWKQEFSRIVIRGGGSLLLSLPALFLAGAAVFDVRLGLTALIFAAVSLILLFYPRLFRVDYFVADKGLSNKEAGLYACHCSVVVLPQFLGVLRYYLGKHFNTPLRNKRQGLVTSTLR